MEEQSGHHICKRAGVISYIWRERPTNLSQVLIGIRIIITLCRPPCHLMQDVHHALEDKFTVRKGAPEPLQHALC